MPGDDIETLKRQLEAARKDSGQMERDRERMLEERALEAAKRAGVSGEQAKHDLRALRAEVEGQQARVDLATALERVKRQDPAMGEAIEAKIAAVDAEHGLAPAVVLNPEAIGDPEQTPVVQLPAGWAGLMRNPPGPRRMSDARLDELRGNLTAALTGEDIAPPHRAAAIDSAHMAARELLEALEAERAEVAHQERMLDEEHQEHEELRDLIRDELPAAASDHEDEEGSAEDQIALAAAALAGSSAEVDRLLERCQRLEHERDTARADADKLRQLTEALTASRAEAISERDACRKIAADLEATRNVHPSDLRTELANAKREVGEVHRELHRVKQHQAEQVRLADSQARDANMRTLDAERRERWLLERIEVARAELVKARDATDPDTCQASATRALEALES